MTELKFKDELFLTRKDLNRASKNLPFDEIDMEDFRISKQCFASCSYADFTDDDGQTKVLKSRQATPILSKVVRLNVLKRREGNEVKNFRFDPHGVPTEISAKDLLQML